MPRHFLRRCSRWSNVFQAPPQIPVFQDLSKTKKKNPKENMELFGQRGVPALSWLHPRQNQRWHAHLFPCHSAGDVGLGFYFPSLLTNAFKITRRGAPQPGGAPCSPVPSQPHTPGSCSRRRCQEPGCSWAASAAYPSAPAGAASTPLPAHLSARAGSAAPKLLRAGISFPSHGMQPPARCCLKHPGAPLIKSSP